MLNVKLENGLYFVRSSCNSRYNVHIYNNVPKTVQHIECVEDVVLDIIFMKMGQRVSSGMFPIIISFENTCVVNV